MLPTSFDDLTSIIVESPTNEEFMRNVIGWKAAQDATLTEIRNNDEPFATFSAALTHT